MAGTASLAGQSPIAPSLTMVVAMTPSGVIGRDGGMPWRLSTDLRRFKRLTLGGVLIMGRKTYESIGRPLPGRRTVVLSRDPHWESPGVQTCTTPGQAIELLGPDRGFVVGGAQIYRLMLPYCKEICLTRVWSSVAGDTVVDLDWSGFQVIETTRIPASEKDDVATEFVRMKKNEK